MHSHIKKLITDRKLPSHQWAQKNTGKLDAISDITEAEIGLVKAIEWAVNNRESPSIEKFGKRKIAKERIELDKIYQKHHVTNDKGMLVKASDAERLFTRKLINEEQRTEVVHSRG